MKQTTLSQAGAFQQAGGHSRKRQLAATTALLLLLVCGCAQERFPGAQWVVVSTNLPAPRITSAYSPDAQSNRLQRPEYDTLKRAIEQSPASPELKQKMLEGKPLGLADIIQLTAERVDDTLVVDYIRATDTVYVLTSADIMGLRAAAVSDRVMDVMLATRLRPTVVPYPRYYPYYHDPFWAYPYYPYHYPYYYRSYPRSVIRRHP